jgi:hypothetical protein
MRRRKFFGLTLAALFISSARFAFASAETPTETSGKQKEVIHIVLFKFMDSAAPRQIDQLLKDIQALQSAIPGILAVTCGENFSPRAKGYTHAVTIRFVNRGALDAFYPHPVHQHLIATSIKPIISDLLPLDSNVHIANLRVRQKFLESSRLLAVFNVFLCYRSLLVPEGSDDRSVLAQS